METKTEKGQDNLRCVLTDEELLVYGKRQAQLLSDRAKAEDELDAFKSGIKNRLAIVDAEVNSLSERIRNGYEFRFVPITIITDWDKETVKRVRDDTGEIYGGRVLNADERQAKMDLTVDMKRQLEEEVPV